MTLCVVLAAVTSLAANGRVLRVCLRTVELINKVYDSDAAGLIDSA